MRRTGRERPEYLQLFAALPHAHRGLAITWWLLIILSGVLPPIFAVLTGVLVGAVGRGSPLVGPLAATGLVFVLMLVVNPVLTAVSQNLGDQTSALLNQRLLRRASSRPASGIWKIRPSPTI